MILAVIPAILPIVLVLGLGSGLFAWLKFRKTGTGASDAPAIDPAKPTLKMKSGATTAELYRNGPVWAFTVAGAPAGTNEAADAAAVDMAQQFASAIASTPDASIVGAASSPNTDPVEFSIEKGAADDWSWAITKDIEAKIPGVPATTSSVGLGSETSRSRAVLQVLAALSDHLDWLEPIAPLEGGGGPEAPSRPLPGIIKTGNRLAVTNLPAWIAYAAPLVREDLADSKDGAAILEETLGGGKEIPAGARLSGKSLAVVQAKVDATVKSIYDGSYLEVGSPDEQIAAEMVGARLNHPDWWVGRHKDHVILVRPAAAVAPQGGFGANLGTRWEFLIWAGDGRGYDTTIVERKVMEAGKAKNATIKAARQRIDTGFVDIGQGTLVGVTGSALVEPGQATINCGPGKYLDPATGECVKPDDIVLEADDIERSIVAPTWAATTTTSITLFDFAMGSNRARRDWTIKIGVCIEVESDAPFGSLSAQIENGGQGGAGPFGDPFARFNIREAPKPGTVGGSGTALDDFNDFRAPVAFGAQYLAKFERGPTMMVPQVGMVPTVKITKAPTKTPDADFDTCPEDAHWPMPEREAGFLVQPADGNWTAWKPVPKIEIVTSGTKIILRVTVVGLPVFADQEGANGSPALAFPTTYNLRIHMQATGMNP